MHTSNFDNSYQLAFVKSVAQRRGKKIADLLGRGGSQTAEADAAMVVE